MGHERQQTTYLGNHHKQDSLISGKVTFHEKKKNKVFEDIENKSEKQTSRKL